MRKRCTDGAGQGHRCCAGGAQVVPGWYKGAAQVLQRGCIGSLLVMYWWYIGAAWVALGK